jgi:methyl coenzyme M reductase alpha subunit
VSAALAECYLVLFGGDDEMADEWYEALAVLLAERSPA